MYRLKINFKNAFIILFLLITTVLNCSCIFPDNLPVLKNLKAYAPQKLEYGKMNLEDFKKLVSKISPSDIEMFTDGITVIKTTPQGNTPYSLIRVGFKDDKLDWIEFNLARNINISKFISVYGTPKTTDTTYNKDADYLNYDFFNISSGKTDKLAKSITYFGKQTLPITKDNQKKSVKIAVSSKNKKKFFEKFPNIQPGITIEADFLSENPNLISSSDKNKETESVYVLSDELGEAQYYYDKAILKFENGLLTWVNLIPKSLPVADCLKIIKTPYKKENINSLYELYDFSKFILVVDKKTKSVKSIGLFSGGVKL